jgi:phosphoribosyl-AMP cyclohydrolase
MPFDPATLKYDAAGLIPCVAQDHASGEVLMVAWMNAASVAATLETGKVTYWSRSRALLGQGGNLGASSAAGGVAARL